MVSDQYKIIRREREEWDKEMYFSIMYLFLKSNTDLLHRQQK